MKFSFVIFICLFNIICQTISSSNRSNCYVLALAGGGDAVAFEAGAIKGLVDYVPNEEVKWDVVTGISAGSLNAVGLSIHAPGDEKTAVEFIINGWCEVKGHQDFYTDWPFGKIEGLLFKSGLYDFNRFPKFLEKLYNGRSLKRKFVCGATNFITGSYDTWDETIIENDYINAIVASSTIPFIFPIKSYGDNYYLDGGLKLGVDVASGINKCFEMGYDENEISIDVISNSSKNLSSPDDPKRIYSLGVLYRALEIYIYNQWIEDIIYSKQLFPNVKFRYVIYPTMILPSKQIPLDFLPDQIETMINYGVQDSKKVVEMGEGTNFDNLIRDFNSQKEKLYRGRGRSIK